MLDGSGQAIGLSTINGIPAHVLMVHFVVVLVPLAALAVVLAVRPAYARRFGLALPALGIAALGSVLLAMNAGGWLQNHVQNTALVQRHTHLAGQLWPFSVGVALVSVVMWWLNRSDLAAGDRSTGAVAQRGTAARATVVAVLAVLLAVISVVQVIRIGESGSRAAWNGRFSKTSIQSTR